MEFSELALHPDLKRAVDEAGYTTCMPVQEMVFPHAFAGGDIYAQSQTGTGKTAAFLVSIFQRVMTVPELRTKKTLVLAPTRELAVQIEAEARKLAKHLPISSGAFYGGVSYGPQVDMLRADVQMIIGTPGRIIDLIQQGKMLLKEVGFLVIDEADRMFDMGFIDDLRRLLRYLPSADLRQTFLFSATLGMRVKDLAWEYMRSPKEIVIEPEHVTVELVTQELYHVGNHEKFRLLLGILARENPKSSLIFCNQKFMVEEVARRLAVNGVECEFIMGDLPQAKRLQIIERLKAGRTEILVATDVAARGLDVVALDLVINYDVPEEPESYVHRIGRTARAGKAGKAVTLACEKFVYGLYGIEKFLGTKIPVFPFGESLLPEDKSSGIRYGHARDRGRISSDGRSSRDGRREPRRDGRRDGRADPRGGGVRRDAGHGPRREGLREPPRDGARERARDGAREGLRQGARDGVRDGVRDGEREGERTGVLPGKGGNPYARSQDERMRSYKEKYGVQPASSGKPAPRTGQGRAPEAPRREPPPSAPPKASSKAPPQPVKAPPSGILERLKGLFGRKKKGA
jgi:ATP-dependent RNA helicase RhlB